MDGPFYFENKLLKKWIPWIPLDKYLVIAKYLSNVSMGSIFLTITKKKL
jgi:hypothetical protein